MVLESYDVGTLKQELRQDTGFESDSANDERLLAKINQAQSWIVRARPNWPWQRKELSLDVPVQQTGTASVTQGSTTCVVASGSPIPSTRDVLVFGSSSSGDGSIGYLVTAVSGQDVTLQSQFRGATNATVSYHIQTGYMELPDDFLRMDLATDVIDQSSRRFTYMDTARFTSIKRSDVVGLGDRIYTIKPDPLNSTGKFYLAVYPYISTLTTLQGEYFFDPPKLVNDSDVPIVPRNDRLCLFYFAAWFISQAVGVEDKALLYRDQAMSQMQTMKDQAGLSDDIWDQREHFGMPGMDLSAVRDFEFPNFEDFNPAIV